MEDEPNARHYLARGRCHACLSMFQEAINDLTKAIDLDDEISDVILTYKLINYIGIL
jgi:tetratricopeptide (TPR) repeat protein